MQKLGKWHTYKPKPEEVPQEIRHMAERVQFFRNEQGVDWYIFQKTLEPGVYAMRDDDGTIHQIQNDLTKLAPARGELVRLDMEKDLVEDEVLIDSFHGTVMDDQERITIKRPPLRLNALEFMQRFTLAERKAIRRSNNEDVQDFFDLLRAANTYFGLDNPLLTQGLDLLVSQNLLTPARRAEILADEE